ncbi:extracellular catalytic domain type 1 short-chain-length polyhydroxyalkanoate depolymerase [Effusibacillus pohliae]|uniref:extracellular catalytic domain type 1 short-chain-length polyhydroxyalkanoate depolymerase n=1 Tax=Effusibacillus pohliae TaxID=232270 RepID=UPI000380AE08|nr:PHB depolymerase family esterase [Effusibacillus pohliae]
MAVLTPITSGLARLLFVLSFALVMSLAGTGLKLAHAGSSSWTEYYYGSGFYFKVYVPSTYTGSQVPLMVMLHGCQQNADDFAAGTQMNSLAEQKNFIVLYPEMNYAANPNGCWNWFYTYNQVRGSGGEPDIIAGMVNWVKSHYAINSSKVYVAGLSAGGFMATIMGVTYPDIFHAVGVHSGGDYSYAYDASTGLAVMTYGTINPVADGDSAYQQMGTHARPVPVIEFHGDNDTVVNPINGTQCMQQWARTDQDAGASVHSNPDSSWNGQVSGGYSYTVYNYNDNSGKNWLQHYVVHGMGHAWSGGSTAGSYTDPYGPNASQIMWNFFTSH